MQLDRASFTLQSYTNLILLPMVLLQKNTKLQTGALKFFLKIGIKVILNLCCSLITYHLMYYFEKKKLYQKMRCEKLYNLYQIIFSISSPFCSKQKKSQINEILSVSILITHYSLNLFETNGNIFF